MPLKLPTVAKKQPIKTFDQAYADIKKPPLPPVQKPLPKGTPTMKAPVDKPVQKPQSFQELVERRGIADEQEVRGWAERNKENIKVEEPANDNVMYLRDKRNGTQTVFNKTNGSIVETPHENEGDVDWLSDDSIGKILKRNNGDVDATIEELRMKNLDVDNGDLQGIVEAYSMSHPQDQPEELQGIVENDIKMDRAMQLVENGEFDNIDEAYEYATLYEDAEPKINRPGHEEQKPGIPATEDVMNQPFTPEEDPYVTFDKNFQHLNDVFKKGTITAEDYNRHLLSEAKRLVESLSQKEMRK